MTLKHNKFLLIILFISLYFNFIALQNKLNDKTTEFTIFINQLYREVDQSITLIDGALMTYNHKELSSALEFKGNSNSLTLASFSNGNTSENWSRSTLDFTVSDKETIRQNTFTHLAQSLNTLDIMLNRVHSYSSSIPNLSSSPSRDLGYIASLIATGRTYNDIQIPPFGEDVERSNSERAYLTELQYFLIKIRDGLQLAESSELNTDINPNRVENLFRDIDMQYFEPLRIQLMNSYYLYLED